MEAIPSDRLVRLLSLMEKNIRAAEKMSLVADPVRYIVQFSKQWFQLQMSHNNNIC